MPTSNNTSIMRRLFTRHRVFAVGFASLLCWLSVAPAVASCLKVIGNSRAASIVNATDTPLAYQCPIFTPYFDWMTLNIVMRNALDKRTSAIKLQVNLVDAFGTILQTWPVSETAHLNRGDTDTVIWGIKKASAVAAQVDHVDVFVLAIKYEDGSMWQSALEPAAGPTPSPADGLVRQPGYIHH